MPKTIAKKITAVAVVTPKPSVEVITPPKPFKRPAILPASVYQFKPPDCDGAIYVIISNAEINGVVKPYELFINSKDVSHQQWVQALTRIISAVFRMGNSEMIAKELSEVFDPRGGFFVPPMREGDKGIFLPSIVAGIGHCIEIHLSELKK